jgi:pimeloyl-ACP methyl ester carboxylesterase
MSHSSRFVFCLALLVWSSLTRVSAQDPPQPYAFYVPPRGLREALPVIYFFDPQGKGVLPLNQYKSLADEYGFILIGSNRSKNGNDYPTSDVIWRELFTESKHRLRIDPRRIYTCGFSGGAKVASFVALYHPEVKGVIAMGAGLPDREPAGDFSFSFTAIAGEGDMNLTELVALNQGLDRTRTRHHIVFFDGIHQWAPLSAMDIAFAGLQLDAMRQGLLPRNPALVDRFVAASKKRLESDIKEDLLIRATQECRLAFSFLDSLTGESAWFKEKAASLETDPRYQRQHKEEEELLVKEQNTKAAYMQHFQQEDLPYWTRTIDNLRAGNHAATREGRMDQRLLAWLSLAFYSFSNQLINNDRNTQARYFVELYKIVDPGNSEAWYFSAILHARSGESRATETDLRKAAANGFNDATRLRSQSEFKHLSPPINLSTIF